MKSKTTKRGGSRRLSAISPLFEQFCMYQRGLMQRTSWEPQRPERDVVMKLSNRVSFLGMLLAVSSFGCGGGSASAPPPPPPAAINVSLSQATATVQAGSTMQFTATVANDPASQGVSWRVTCPSSPCGTVSPDTTASEAATTYTAPTSAGWSDLQVTLTATSVADTTKTASAAISVTPSLMPAALSGSVAVGTAPTGIAVDRTTNKIYVADFGRPPVQTQFVTCPPAGGDVTVINGATESTSTVAIQPPGSAIGPVAIALNETSHAAYVVAQGWGVNFASQQGCFQDFYAVLVLDTSTLVPQRFVLSLYSEGFYLSGIAVNRPTGSIYVGYFAGSTKNIIVITGNGYGTIPVSPGPIAINETTNKIYVASSNGVAVIDGTTNSVSGTIPDPGATAPTAIAVNPTTNAIYVANAQSNNVTVVDGATGAVAATVPVGISPVGIALDEQTNFIYVANAGNSQTGDPGSVTVINGSTNVTTTLVDPRATNPVAVAVNSATHKVYVANKGSNNVTVIEGAR